MLQLNTDSIGLGKAFQQRLPMIRLLEMILSVIYILECRHLHRPFCPRYMYLYYFYFFESQPLGLFCFHLFGTRVFTVLLTLYVQYTLIHQFLYF